MIANPLNLVGKTFLITGASAGIGQDTAIFLAELGARLILVGRNEERLQETWKMLPANDHKISCFDLSQFDAVGQWLKEWANEVGPLHGLVHSAGIHLMKPMRILSEKDYRTVMDANVGSAFSLAKIFCQKGIAQPSASLVFIASVAGLTGQGGVSAYSASKGAIVALTRSLAMEFAASGIRVNCIAPGVVETPMSERLFSQLTDEQMNMIHAQHPLGLGKPRDISHAAAFLLADTARWITGTTLVVDGGYCAH